jgi:hypothetical protein
VTPKSSLQTCCRVSTPWIPVPVKLHTWPTSSSICTRNLFSSTQSQIQHVTQQLSTRTKENVTPPSCRHSDASSPYFARHCIPFTGTSPNVSKSALPSSAHLHSFLGRSPIMAFLNNIPQPPTYTAQLPMPAALTAPQSIGPSRTHAAPYPHPLLHSYLPQPPIPRKSPESLGPDSDKTSKINT